ncbi:MAG: hypothetical protein BWY78_01389 [Alphaproteobacteria bacterium ADurb.Bin438]|nr:MAG: hypothetical protein BWY78_01389 [Alphaproteobacteria bacterium ADurb.Bin438]
MFNANEHQELEFWEENLENYDTKEPARAFASDVIDELKTLGHEIIIMTARCGDFDYNEEKNNHMKQITKNWLLKNNISYDEIIFTPKEKLELCIENKIDLMIEDKASHVMKISKIMPVLCFDAKYNQECFGENIIRVYSWYDVLSKIKSNNLNEPSYKIK